MILYQGNSPRENAAPYSKIFHFPILQLPWLILSFDIDLPEFYKTIMACCGQNSSIWRKCSLTQALHKRGKETQKSNFIAVLILQEEKALPSSKNLTNNPIVEKARVISNRNW